MLLNCPVTGGYRHFPCPSPLPDLISTSATPLYIITWLVFHAGLGLSQKSYLRKCIRLPWGVMKHALSSSKWHIESVLAQGLRSNKRR